MKSIDSFLPDLPTPAPWGLQATSRIILGLVLAGVVFGQTKVDLRKQARDVDFSAAATTKPVKTGTQVPASCSLGEAYFKSDNAPGHNLYICAPANTWSMIAPAESGVPQGGSAGQVISTDGSTATWVSLGGDVSGNPVALAVTKLQGNPVAPGTPLDGQVLHWNASTGQWEAVSASGFLFAGSGVALTGADLSIDDAVVPQYYTGAGIPTFDCTVGRDFYVDASAGVLYFCKAAGVWAAVALAGQSSTTDSHYILQTPDANLPNAQALSTLPDGLLKISAGTGVISTAEGGDLPPHRHSVQDLNGQVGVSSGGTGADLSASGGAGQYVKQLSTGGTLTVGSIASQDLPPAVSRTDQGNTYTTGIQDFTAATATLPAKSGVSLPATCRQGEIYFRTNATPGQNLFFCAPANTWTQMPAAGLADPGSSGILKRTAMNATTAATATDLAAPFYCVDSGNTDSYACSVTPSIPAYTAGLRVNLRANTANSGPASLNLNSLGAVVIQKNRNQDLNDNDIKAGQILELIYDGTGFQMLSPVSNAAAGGSSVEAGSNILLNGDSLSWNRLDTSTAGFFEDFFSSYGSAALGQTFWGKGNIAGTNTFGDIAESSFCPEKHPGVVKMTAGSSSPAQGNGAWAYMTNPLFQTRMRATQLDWTYLALIYYPSFASVRTRIGWTSSATAGFVAPADGIWLRYDANAAFGDNTRNGGNGTWVAEVCSSSAGACSSVDLNIAPSTVWHTVKIRRASLGVGGNPTIYFSIDGSQEKTACISGCDIGAANVPSPNSMLMLGLELLTDTNSTKTVEVDAIGLALQNLAR